MLSAEKNEKLTRVGPGTPAGELLRRYWQPVCLAGDLAEETAKKRVRVLGEDLVVFRGEDGGYAALAERCAHRGCSLYYGFVEGNDVRCAYHGWRFDREGRCVETPFEPTDAFLGKPLQRAYPVQEMAGLLFVYMGPEPAPLLPRWGPAVREDGRRYLVTQPVINCNWLQIEENTLDSVHTLYLHAHTLEAHGKTEGLFGLAAKFYGRPIVDYDWELCEWGITKKIVYGGNLPGEEIRPPMVFPNILVVDVPEQTVHWRVPVDDTHTQIFIVVFEANKDGAMVEQPRFPPVKHVTLDQTLKPNGEYELAPDDFLAAFLTQDRMAWETQGAIANRAAEHLGASDRGIILFRKLLEEQIDIVRQGGDPLGVLRDPAKNELIEFECTPLLIDTTGAAR